MSSTAENQIIDAVRSYLERAAVHGGASILAGGASILVAVSGGPDSVALLRALHSLGGEFELTCCYYDHGLRSAEETGKESEFVRGLAETLGVPFHHAGARPGQIEKSARAEGIGIEAAARRYRYGFFRKLQKRLRAPYLAVGHTRNDQDETVLMRVCRGAGASGLKGVPEYGNSLLRPLIGCTRAEIIGYLGEIGQPYITDPTNEECYFLRNRVRNRVMPLLNDIFPGLATSLDRLREKMRLTDEYLTDETFRLVPWTREEGIYRTEWDRFVAAPRIIRLRALYAVFDLLKSAEDLELPYRFLKPLIYLEESMEAGIIPRDLKSATLARGHGIIIEIRPDPAGDILLLTARGDVAKGPEKGYCVVLEDNFPFKSELLGLQIEKTLVSSSKGDGPRIDYEGLANPIVLRSAVQGDTIQLKEGKKRVRKLFQEWKIRNEEAWRIPVLEDRRGVKAVFGSFFTAVDRFAADFPSPNPKNANTQLVFIKFGVEDSEFSE